MKFRTSVIFLFIVFFFLSCSEPTERIQSKLHPFLQEDLKFMVAEVLSAKGTKEDLLDTPYYSIQEFRQFEGAKAEIYAAYAEVDFYIYKKINLHQKRKYRYDTHYRRWDRYYKKYFFH
ncbi:MAG: hypothetical protein GX116_04640 [Fibrobacter sp.]|jgi:hypothetical protein|nr:hypothetical protein [Fibrobacter sp.]